MNLNELNTSKLENLLESEINELIIESLFPSERREHKFYTNPKRMRRFPTIVSNNGIHEIGIEKHKFNQKLIGNKKSNTYKPNNKRDDYHTNRKKTNRVS